MGKKTDTTKPAAPEKRAAKNLPAAEKITVTEPVPKPRKPAAAKPAAPIAKASVPLTPTPEKPATPAKPGKAPAAAKAKAAAPVAKVTKGAKTKAAKPAYTHDDIALRAYFIAEKRQAAGIHGEPHLDWIEAERQLASETSAKPARKPKAS